MFANAGIGALLYTSYLQILQRNYSAAREERMYPPPGVGLTFTAGMMAGAIQSFVAAPLDALTVRFDVRVCCAAFFLLLLVNFFLLLYYTLQREKKKSKKAGS